jgi:hypothetical protein
MIAIVGAISISSTLLMTMTPPPMILMRCWC